MTTLNQINVLSGDKVEFAGQWDDGEMEYLGSSGGFFWFKDRKGCSRNFSIKDSGKVAVKKHTRCKKGRS